MTLFACQVRSANAIAYCGMHSHSSLTTNAVTMEVETLGREACIMAHKQHILSVSGHTIRDLEIGKTIRQSIVVQGTRDAAGACSRSSFTYRNTRYDGVTMEKELEITLAEEKATVDIHSNEVILSSGVRCDYASLSCSHNGVEYHWEPRLDSSCAAEYEFLTTGPVTILSMSDNFNSSDLYVTANYSDYLFALRLTAPTRICNFNKAFMTEHNKLFFIETETDIPFSKATVDSIDMSLYINSKFLYHEIALKQNLNKLAGELVTKRCELDRQARLNMLSIARSDPGRLATFFNDPALISYLAGEVLYVSRCKTVFVAIRPSSSCYNAVPVIDPSGNHVFISPFTHKLVPFAEEISCNPMLCPKFRFHNSWIEICPNARFIQPPEIITPNQQDIQFTIEGKISTSGIYPSSVIKEYQALMTFGETKQAITASMSRMASGNSPSPNAPWLQNLFPAEQAMSIVKSAYSRVFGWFSEFFWYLSGISGIISMISIIKYILTVIFNAFHIKDVAGCSKYTLLAFCGPCAKIFIHHQLKVQLQEHANQKFSAIEKHVLGLNPPVTSQPSSTYNSILDLWEEHQKNLPAPPVIVQHDNCILQ